MLRVEIRRKAFPALAGAPARILFEGLALAIPEGQVCAVLGPSGVGKSSLLGIVAGLDGDFDGIVTGRPAPVGYQFQSPRLLPWRTVRENLALAGAEAGGIDGWLAAVGLEGQGEVYPGRLSAGMARRVALARALAIGPRLLLLDEPFAALDEATAGAMRRLLSEHLRQRRPTTLLVTHDPADAVLADRVLVLDGAPARIGQDCASKAPR